MHKLLLSKFRALPVKTRAISVAVAVFAVYSLIGGRLVERVSTVIAIYIAWHAFRWLWAHGPAEGSYRPSKPAPKSTSWFDDPDDFERDERQVEEARERDRRRRELKEAEKDAWRRVQDANSEWRRVETFCLSREGMNSEQRRVWDHMKAVEDEYDRIKDELKRL